MLHFRYVGRTKRGFLKRGMIQSQSRNQAIQQLKNEGIQPREVTETEPSLFHRTFSWISKRVKQEDFIVYCRQFATLIRAGITIVEATNILTNQTESKGLKHVLKKIEKELRDGQSFSAAVQKFPRVFPPIFVNMIRAGEMMGMMDKTLDHLANYFEKQYQLKKKIQSTLAYPIVLIVIIIAVVIFLMVSIVPVFQSMFAQFDSELPLITQLVVHLSDLIRHWWWIGFLSVMGIVGVFIYLFKQNKRFHYFIHVAILKMPIFGTLLQKALIARMTRTLSSLLASSVPVLQALEIVAKVVNNPVIEEVVLKSQDSLEKGHSLSEPLRKSWVFPLFVSQMTMTGEETGALDSMLAKIADSYEENVDRTVDTLRSLIEPVMIIILAVVVGLIVLSIMVPMLAIISEIN